MPQSAKRAECLSSWATSWYCRSSRAARGGILWKAPPYVRAGGKTSRGLLRPQTRNRHCAVFGDPATPLSPPRPSPWPSPSCSLAARTVPPEHCRPSPASLTRQDYASQPAKKCHFSFPHPSPRTAFSPSPSSLQHRHSSALTLCAQAPEPLIRPLDSAFPATPLHGAPPAAVRTGAHTDTQRPASLSFPP